MSLGKKYQKVQQVTAGGFEPVTSGTYAPEFISPPRGKHVCKCTKLCLFKLRAEYNSVKHSGQHSGRPQKNVEIDHTMFARAIGPSRLSLAREMVASIALDYRAPWPLPVVRSSRALTNYQMMRIFRQWFFAKYVERQCNYFGQGGIRGGRQAEAGRTARHGPRARITSLDSPNNVNFSAATAGRTS